MFISDFSFSSVVLRLMAAAVAGGIVGYGRLRKNQPAGLRTYIICCLGATLATLSALYVNEMLQGAWNTGGAVKFDAARYPAAVISGIGFLAAGSIIRTEYQQIAGLTTAIVMFTDVCMGISIGIGFYQAVIGILFVQVILLDGMYSFERLFRSRTPNITLLIRFRDINNVNDISRLIRESGAGVTEYELEQVDAGEDRSAVFWISLPKGNSPHTELMSSVAELSCVTSVQELLY